MSFSRRSTLPIASLLLLASLAGCQRHDNPAGNLSAMAQLGRKMFFDPALSASGQMACASCHDPAHAYGPANALPVQMGGPHLNLQGGRAVPSLTYLLDSPNFSIGPEDTLADDPKPGTTVQQPSQSSALAGPAPANLQRLARNTPTTAKATDHQAAATAMVPQGGFFWDGRADTLQGQALGPLLNPLEMGNADEAEIVAKLRKASYAGDFISLFGPNVLKDQRLLLAEGLFALARFQVEEKSFHPYDSKYDAYLAGKTSLSDAEARGLKLFEDPKKGNCSSCHLDKRSPDGHPPQFTDFQFEGLGVPRNGDIAANANPAFYDLGICGPVRKDSYSQQAQNCGLFKTPSLRNVARRQAYFHNGAFHTLKDVLHFYVERDIHPEKFYPKGADGQVQKFNDVPAQYRANMDVIDAPFDRKPGDQPALSDAEIEDVIAFLGTLNDGYKP